MNILKLNKNYYICNLNTTTMKTLILTPSNLKTPVVGLFFLEGVFLYF